MAQKGDNFSTIRGSGDDEDPNENSLKRPADEILETTEEVNKQKKVTLEFQIGSSQNPQQEVGSSQNPQQEVDFSSCQNAELNLRPPTVKRKPRTITTAPIETPRLRPPPPVPRSRQLPSHALHYDSRTQQKSWNHRPLFGQLPSNLPTYGNPTQQQSWLPPPSFGQLPSNLRIYDNQTQQQQIRLPPPSFEQLPSNLSMYDNRIQQQIRLPPPSFEQLPSNLCIYYNRTQQQQIRLPPPSFEQFSSNAPIYEREQWLNHPNGPRPPSEVECEKIQHDAPPYNPFSLHPTTDPVFIAPIFKAEMCPLPKQVIRPVLQPPPPPQRSSPGEGDSSSDRPPIKSFLQDNREENDDIPPRNEQNGPPNDGSNDEAPQDLNLSLNL